MSASSDSASRIALCSPLCNFLIGIAAPAGFS
jgi:hypothetical protein